MVSQENISVNKNLLIAFSLKTWIIIDGEYYETEI